jgi:MoaA/NifB/PqqE/SkfB family radical SAM enzyme
MNPRQFAADKILHHLEVIQAWKDGKNPYAITTEIDPTNACNHKCPGCAGGTHRGMGADNLSIKEMRSILKQVKELGGKAVTFTGGGEPLLNKGTGAAIDYASYLGLDIGLVTNGTRAKVSGIASIIASCTWIRVSLDAGSPEMHERTHGSKDYYAILDNIDCLVAVKKKIKSGCTIGVGYLTGVGTSDYEDMMNFVDTAIKLKVDYAQFRPYHVGGAKSDLAEFEKKLDFAPFYRKSTQETAILCSQHKYDCINRGILSAQYGECFGHQFATVIEATGNMTICCHTRGMECFALGNIKLNTIKTIWGSQQRQEAIANINLAACTPLCRADTFNCILWELSQKKEHVNFL